MKSDVVSGLAAHLGSFSVADAEERSRWTADGIDPGAVVFPRSVEELAEILGRATEEGWSVLPAGRGRWLGGGGLPSEVDVVVSTREMNRVVEYVPDDLTLTAEAGLGLGRLAATTREHGQWLAQDPPGWHDGTLGAFASTGLPGPLVAGFGRPRDHLLGLTAVTGDGRILRPGGKVVKNVAGFDLVRLLAGSWGTLGVIASVTVRLFPVPRTDVTLLLQEPVDGGVPAVLLEHARAWATAPVLPEALELLMKSSREGTGGAVLAARLLGSAEEVAEKERILREAAGGSEPRRIEGEESRRFQDRLTRAPDSVAGEGGVPNLLIRLAALPSRLGAALDVAEELRHQAEATGSVGRSRASVTRGTICVELTSDLPPEAAFPTELWGPLLESCRERMSGLEGTLTILRGTRALRHAVADRGPVGPRERLAEGVRREFDPAGVLAPGRSDGEGSR
ncbi:MAG: FAD-binding oxidoreductase [Longimicrobiales bacterium]|nr:FAD-binding oxidoreductase [Longimicrobiales bacterium]